VKIRVIRVRMKELLKQLAAYNLWANQQLLETVLLLDEEKQKYPMVSSFASLHDTLLHMWNSESVWWQRIKMTERIVAPAETFSGNMDDLKREYLQQNQQWVDLIIGISDAGLDHVFQYYNTKREYFKQPVYQVLQHVFNHGTYHRGQLVTMLRQLGVEKIPATDFIVWTRKK
jgi:uncharacterized damage-inducible protein DinB